ncbi:TIGR04104 family putative zinc finger protein [Sporosarcina luteola]|uniref:TIGR04104 family putative zinc finger protein n=1 Tax=Bacillales TaxID=1385 RepID=UPI0033405FCC
MQKCENCNAHFSWRKIYKSLWWNYKPIECNECDTTHKMTMPSRLIFVSITILPMLTFGYFLSPFSNGLMTFSISILILIIGSLLAPFLVTYKKSL